MRQIRVRSSARADLFEIQKYTQDNWGLSKVIELEDLVDDTFSRLALSPYIGRKTNSKNVFAYTLGKLPFVMVYKLDETHIYINKIIHTKRNR